MVHTWRRLHGRDLVAQVEPIAGLGAWAATAFRNSEPTVIARLPRAEQLLQTAQLKADELARKAFGHDCAADTCGGAWLPVVRD